MKKRDIGSFDHTDKVRGRGRAAKESRGFKAPALVV